jgi:hypothetical protein
MPDHPDPKLSPYWRRVQLAARWQCSDREIDRRRQDGRLGEPALYLGRAPLWTNEQVEAAEARGTERAREVACERARRAVFDT